MPRAQVPFAGTARQGRCVSAKMIKTLSMYVRHKFAARSFFLCAIIFSLFVRAGAAYSQQPTLTPTETPTGEITPTFPTALTTAVTETATPGQTATDIIPSATEQRSGPRRRVLVKISPNARIVNVMSRMGEYGTVVRNSALAEVGVFVLEVPEDDFEKQLVTLGNLSGVGYVEPDYPVQALDTIPNDPSFPNQYALQAIRAPQGWDISTGSPSVTIAIVDSGVDLGHPDLAGKLVQGIDFVNNDAIPQDDYGHGTHVAGIAAAQTNNGIGIAGVSWGARILPIKVLDAFGQGSFSNVAAGIIWATDRGAQVINLSVGGANYSQILADAVSYADQRGVLLVASAGNAGSNFVLYPAHLPQVMAVAATNSSNQRAGFSNYGPEIDIAAPGEAILSLWPGGYNTLSGTSMAAPYVSGLAAVLFGVENNAAAVRNDMEASALDLAPAGVDIYTGAGLIQMDAALRRALRVPTSTTAPTQGGSGTGGGGGFIPANPVSTTLPTLTLTATFTALPAPVSATASLTVVPSSSPTLTLPQETVSLLTPGATPAQQRPDFRSPYFCGGILLISIGILIGFLVRRDRRF